MGEKLSFSFMTFYMNGLTSEQTYIHAIKDLQNIMKNSPIKNNAFVYGPITTFWEVFLQLDAFLWIVMGADAVIIFFVTLVVFSFDFMTAFVTCTSCSMIVLEIYGLSSCLMNFNIFVAAISLMGMGLSVEFTAHLAAAFSFATGSTQERLGSAMARTFPALMEGSVSTFFSILPLAFAKEMFMVKYLFGIMALVVATGLMNGLVVMPALLSLLSPVFGFVRTFAGTRDDKGAGNASLPANGNQQIRV